MQKFLCVKTHGQSCRAFIGLTIHAKIIGEGVPFYLKFWIKLTAFGAKSPNFDLFSLVAIKKFLSVKIVSDRVVRHSLR